MDPKVKAKLFTAMSALHLTSLDSYHVLFERIKNHKALTEFQELMDKLEFNFVFNNAEFWNSNKVVKNHK